MFFPMLALYYLLIIDLSSTLSSVSGSLELMYKKRVECASLFLCCLRDSFQTYDT